MSVKVLFIYPNTYGMNMLPPAIALFSSLLKQRGYSVDLFDATYYQIDHGGGYGLTSNLHAEKHELKICDKFFTWRWSSEHIKTLPMAGEKLQSPRQSIVSDSN